MKNWILPAAALTGLAMSSWASAAVTVTVQNVGTPAFNSTATGTATGYTGYVISLVSDQGTISAYDFQSANNGFTGPLVQRRTASDPDGNPGVYDTSILSSSAVNSTPNVANVDSHFFAGTQLFVGATLSESLGTGGLSPVSQGTPTAPGLPNNSASSGYYIAGSNGALKGYTGIDSASQVTTQIVAYLVVPNTATVTGSGLVATNGGTASLPVSFTISPVGVPEPATLGLAALGLGGVVLRRGRRD